MGQDKSKSTYLQDYTFRFKEWVGYVHCGRTVMYPTSQEMRISGYGTGTHFQEIYHFLVKLGLYETISAV